MDTTQPYRDLDLERQQSIRAFRGGLIALTISVAFWLALAGAVWTVTRG
jgi:hypothetical protein